MSHSLSSPTHSKGYLLGVFAIGFVYLVFQAFYIPYTVLARDELWFAHHIYQYTLHVPYRDFAPYKTVLGYYLLSLPLYVVHGVIAPLWSMKGEIAILNAIMLVMIGVLAQQWFAKRAVVYVLLMLMASELFLLYSADLRVDMIASWLCLVSVLLLLQQRAVLAGIVLAVGFCVSQKALWYVMATSGALFLQIPFTSNQKATRTFVACHAGMVATLFSYIIIWSLFSNVKTVLHSVFYEAYTQAQIHFYATAYGRYWRTILQDGPVFLLLLPLTALSLLDAAESPFVMQRRFFIMTYAWLALVFIALYQQFFPYNIVFLVPAFFVLYSEWLTGLLHRLEQPPIKKSVMLSSRALFWFFALYFIALCAVELVSQLTVGYVVVSAIGGVVWWLLSTPAATPSARAGAKNILLLTLIFTGVLLPLARTAFFVNALDGHYQRETIMLAHQLLATDETYVAGVPVLYDKDQTIAGLKNLIAPAVSYLNSQDPVLLPVLLPALDMTPRTVPAVLADLRAQPVKFLVNNDRIGGLPLPLFQYLQQEFQHYWGGIYLYSPTVQPRQTHIMLKFTGEYQVEATTPAPLIVDGKIVSPNTRIHLTKGLHTVQATTMYRMRWLPTDLTLPNNPATFHDCTACFAKPIVM